MIFCLPLDIHVASLNIISHKPGISLMLLGAPLALQTPMAHGLATIPSSGKLGIVSQLRLVSGDEAVPARALGLGVQ